MKRTNLQDVTFQIPTRIDSPERQENLDFVLDYLTSNFETKIVLLEADEAEKVYISSKYITKIFIEDQDACFYRTAYLNKMTLMSNTPFLAIWDTDVLVRPEQIVKAVKMLRENKADLVYPYNGCFHYTNQTLREFYKQCKDFELLEYHLETVTTHLEYPAVGGGFFVRKSNYINAGMENLTFKGWGPEDKERLCRIEILGNRVEWISDGPMIHLFHPRLGNSNYQKNSMKKLRGEYLKVSNMKPSELKNYIQSWKQPNLYNL
jgi:predicted glycosyltransferase involved in capsule biosynthesis